MDKTLHIRGARIAFRKWDVGDMYFSIYLGEMILSNKILPRFYKQLISNCGIQPDYVEDTVEEYHLSDLNGEFIWLIQWFSCSFD